MPSTATKELEELESLRKENVRMKENAQLTLSKFGFDCDSVDPVFTLCVFFIALQGNINWEELKKEYKRIK